MEVKANEAFDVYRELYVATPGLWIGSGAGLTEQVL
jgi:hypothetical protein